MYVYARLAWDPDSSWRDALADFCRKSYGAGADPMLKHWTILESAREKWDSERARCEQFLRQALAVAGNTEVRRRINRIAELWQESACQKNGDPVGPCKK